MGKCINRVNLIGYIGGEIDYKSFDGGSECSSFSLATSETYIKEGQKYENTEWHNIVIWGKMAKTCQVYLGKGAKVYIEGKLRTESWNDQNGQKKYTTKVVVSDIVFLSLKPNESVNENVSPDIGEKSEDDDLPF